MVSKKGDMHLARRPDRRDVMVGKHLRLRRMECGLTQPELAERIGVAYQQIQQYERGVSRIGASRLQRIAAALDVPITFFFAPESEMRSSGRARRRQSVFDLMQTADSVRIVKAFHKIRNPKKRQMLVDMAEKLATA